MRKRAENFLNATEAVLALAGVSDDQAPDDYNAVQSWIEWLRRATARDMKTSQGNLRIIEDNYGKIAERCEIVISPSEAIRLYEKVSAQGVLILSKSEALQIFSKKAFRRFDIDAIPMYAKISIPDRTVDLPERNLYRDSHWLFLLAKDLKETLDQASSIPVLVITPSTLPVDIGRQASFGLTCYAIEGLCRMSVIAGYSCVEAFVAGLGVDFIERNPGIPAARASLFKEGREKGRFLSLERRMERFIKELTGKPPRVPIADRTQHVEPFKSFFGDVEPFRHAIAHPSGLKNLRLTTDEYLRQAEVALERTVEVVKAIHKQLKGTDQGRDDYLFWLLRGDEVKRPDWYAKLVKNQMARSIKRPIEELFEEFGKVLGYVGEQAGRPSAT